MSTRKRDDIERQKVIGPSNSGQFTIQGQITSPLPPPDWMSKYQAINPKFSEVIVEMLLKEQQHRHTIDTITSSALADDIKNERKAQKCAQWLSWSIAIGCLIGVVICALNGMEYAAIVVAATPLTTAIAAIIGKKKETTKENLSDI